MRVTSMTRVTASATSGPNFRANSGQLGARSAPNGGTAVLQTVALNALTCATCSFASLHGRSHLYGAGLVAAAGVWILGLMQLQAAPALTPYNWHAQICASGR